MILKIKCRHVVFVLLAAVISSESAAAEPAAEATRGSRWDVSLELTAWPGLQDLRPAAGNSFDSVGFGLGASWHWPVAQFTRVTKLSSDQR